MRCIEVIHCIGIVECHPSASHTLPAFRGRRIFGAVLRVFLTDLSALGITSAFFLAAALLVFTLPDRSGEALE